MAIARIIEPHVASVEIVNTRRLKAISESKQKTDRHDTKTLAQLLAAGMLEGSGGPTKPPGRCVAASRDEPGWSPTAPAPRTSPSPCFTATSNHGRR